MRRLTGLALAVVTGRIVRPDGAGPVGVSGCDRGVRVRRVRARLHAGDPLEQPRPGSLVDARGDTDGELDAAGARGGPDAGRDGDAASGPSPRGRLVRPDRSRGPAVGGWTVSVTAGVGTASDRIAVLAGSAVVPLYSPAQRYASLWARLWGQPLWDHRLRQRRTRGTTGATEPIVGLRHPAGPVLESLSGGSGRSLGVSGGYNGWGPSVRRDNPDEGRKARMRGHHAWKRPPGRLLAVVIGAGDLGSEADAQGVAGSRYMSSYRVSDYFVEPGWYGTSYGFASYGIAADLLGLLRLPGPVLRARTTRPTASCRGDSASASGGRDTSRRDMSTGLRITPRRGSPTGRSR